MAVTTWLLTLHLIGAAGWVGGQLLLGPVTGVLRRRGVDREIIQSVARAANPVLWASFVLAIGTGFAMLASLDLLGAEGFGYPGRLIENKISLAILAAIAVGVHIYARKMPEGSKARRAMLGGGAGVGLLASLGILFFAAQLRFPL